MRIFFSIFFLAACLTLGAPPAFAHSEGSHEILMNDSGFEPRETTINKGEKVVFKNVGKDKHWPASNIHPTHTVYPGSDIKKCGTDGAEKIFDACFGIAPGESYEFTFDEAGEWRFHDHLSSDLSGKITVIGEPTDSSPPKKGFFGRLWDGIGNIWHRLARLVMPQSSEAQETTDTVESDLPVSENTPDIFSSDALIASYVKKFGIRKTMARLVEESGGGSVFDCHQQSHAIGRIGYGIEKEKAFQECNASCHSGCYHGAMESFLNQNGTDNLASKIDGICKLFETSFGNFECLHGVGHGVLAYLDYNLPEAINECGKLNGSFAHSSCYGGLFMENILTGQGLGASEKDHKTNWVNQTDPLFPCNKISDEYAIQYECYQMQTSWMLNMNSFDFKKVSDLCLTAPENMVPVCYKSLGRDIAGHVLRDPLKIKELCRVVPAEYRNICIVGAVNVIVDFHGPGLTNQGSQLCSILDGGEKEACYTNLAGRLNGLYSNPKDKKNACNTLEPTYRNICS